MEIKIIVSGDGYDSEHEMNMNEIYSAELALILTSLKVSTGNDENTIASLIPGLISIGIDLAIKTYGTVRTKRITKQFIDDCLGWK